MKIVKIHAGLGNQIFQYALFLGLKKYGHKVKVDYSEFELYNIHHGYELQRTFNINLPHINSFEKKLYAPRRPRFIYRVLRKCFNTDACYMIEQPEFCFSEEVLFSQKTKYLNGYWQHHRYVDLVEEELRQNLKFPKINDPQNEKLLKKIQHHNSVVSIHVRRGDYLNHPTLGGLCDLNYYRKAIDYIKFIIPNPLFVFFSNDIAWCRQNFNSEEALYVDWNRGEDSFRDMQLMSLCHHHIIANSSFSWWAAWLNSRPDKIVIAPKKWINLPEADPKALLLDHFILL